MLFTSDHKSNDSMGGLRCKWCFYLWSTAIAIWSTDHKSMVLMIALVGGLTDISKAACVATGGPRAHLHPCLT